jgi:carbon monoxide dehydrogenase subunit G
MAAITIDERFRVGAPQAAVWDFLVDPRRVVGCVPGGELGAVLDDRTFDGTVRVEVGPLTLAYGGRVELAEVDAVARRVKIVGRARERAGTDSARLTLESWLDAPPEGGTEVTARARVDVAGRIVGLGLGFLQPLAHLVFQEFAARVGAEIEAAEARRRSGVAGGGPVARTAPLRAFPLVLRALRAWLSAWIGRTAALRRRP